MCEFKDMRGYLIYFGKRYESIYHERNELINEAWIAMHDIENPKYIANAVKWAMMNYMRQEKIRYRYFNQNAVFVSIDKQITEIFSLKDCIFDPLNDFEGVENSDQLKHISRRLSLAERLLLDQRYYQELTLRNIAKIHGVTGERIRQRLDKIISKLKAAA